MKTFTQEEMYGDATGCFVKQDVDDLQLTYPTTVEATVRGEHTAMWAKMWFAYTHGCDTDEEKMALCMALLEYLEAVPKGNRPLTRLFRTATRLLTNKLTPEQGEHIIELLINHTK